MLRSPDARGAGWVMGASAGLVLLGAALTVWGASRPPFLDTERARQAFDDWCTYGAGRTASEQAARDLYFGLMSPRYLLIDLGINCVATGVAIAALAYALQRGRSSGSGWLRTPPNRGSFQSLGVAAVWMNWAGAIVGLAVDRQRALFPRCDDSTAISLIGVTLLALVLTPIFLMACGSLASGFGDLPVSLGQWDSRRPRRAWTATILLSLMGLLLLGWTVLVFASSTYIATAGNILALYLAASARAALLAPKRGLA